MQEPKKSRVRIMRICCVVGLCLVCLLSESIALAGGTALTVAADGSGDFQTVQAAIEAIPAKNKEPVMIRIKPGMYTGQIKLLKDKPFVTFFGDAAKTTILTNDWNAKHIGPNGKAVGTSGSFSVLIQPHDFVAENITFENTAGDTGQALALSATGDRQIFRNCRIIGWQDTLYSNGGRQYYDHCYIEGRTDFIFGNAQAVFDHCELHSKNGGYITAGSTDKKKPWGYVFLDCTLTGTGQMAELGRPWYDYASATYIRCEMGAHINPLGWNNFGNPAKEKTARFAEYKCTGPGADRSGRVPWSRELTDDEASNLTIEKLLDGEDQWNPSEAK
jgi:pectinesterase